MPKQTKLNLNDLSVESFVTNNQINGGLVSKALNYDKTNGKKCVNSEHNICIPGTEYYTCSNGAECNPAEM